jgi:integrase
MPHKHKINGIWTGKWLGQFKRNGQRIRKLCDSKRAAKAWEVEMKRSASGQVLQSGPPSTTATICLLDWANKYLDYSAARYSIKTYSEKKNILKRCLDAFGRNTLVDAIKPGHALEYLQQQFKQRSGHAANKERKNLVAAWNYGSRFIEGFPHLNPFLAVQQFPEAAQSRYVPSEQDLWKVFEGARGQDRVMLLAFLHTAARRGELYRLQWSDVDFDRQCIRLTTKKRQNGSLEADWIPMTDVLVSALLEHRQSAVSEWVFTQTEGRRQGRAYIENRGFPRELCLSAGVKPFGCHAIRHLTASILAKHNTPMVQIQEILRHRKLATTERYIRGLEPVRPYLKVLEEGFPTKKANNGSNTNEKGLRAITS